MYLESSTSAIRSKENSARIVNAIGEMILVTVVKEICRSFVKIRPTANMLMIIPAVIKRPRVTRSFLELATVEPFLSCTWFAK